MMNCTKTWLHLFQPVAQAQINKLTLKVHVCLCILFNSIYHYSTLFIFVHCCWGEGSLGRRRGERGRVWKRAITHCKLLNDCSTVMNIKNRKLEEMEKTD